MLRLKRINLLEFLETPQVVEIGGQERDELGLLMGKSFNFLIVLCRLLGVRFASSGGPGFGGLIPEDLICRLEQISQHTTDKQPA